MLTKEEIKTVLNHIKKETKTKNYGEFNDLVKNEINDLCNYAQNHDTSELLSKANRASVKLLEKGITIYLLILLIQDLMEENTETLQYLKEQKQEEKIKKAIENKDKKTLLKIAIKALKNSYYLVIVKYDPKSDSVVGTLDGDDYNKKADRLIFELVDYYQKDPKNLLELLTY